MKLGRLSAVCCLALTVTGCDGSSADAPPAAKTEASGDRDRSGLEPLLAWLLTPEAACPPPDASGELSAEPLATILAAWDLRPPPPVRCADELTNP